MPSNINTVLADCEQKAKQLVAEIQKYQAAGALSTQAAAALNKLCVALEDVHRRIRPLTESNVTRFLYALTGATALNFFLLVTILVFLLRR